MPSNPERDALPQFVQMHRPDSAALRDELVAGLSGEWPAVAPKFFYDALGSRLFEAITELDEYYPTRTEAAIFEQHGRAIARECGSGHTLVDLGAGNCAKAESLFAVFEPARYVAVDISVDYLRQSLSGLQARHPRLPTLGVGQDFSQHLELPPQAGDGPRLMFYPGSSIGNFAPADAAAFLGRVRRACNGGALLVGVDLVKPVAVLERAYDDPLGVTAAFNLNLLRNVNRLLRSDFDVTQWQHLSRFDAARSRIEMYLKARCDLRVNWPGGGRRFGAGQLLHTENSCKYTVPGFEGLLREAGCRHLRHWTDAQRGFAVFVAR